MVNISQILLKFNFYSWELQESSKASYLEMWESYLWLRNIELVLAYIKVPVPGVPYLIKIVYFIEISSVPNAAWNMCPVQAVQAILHVCKVTVT
jgi:hypothetical protein